MTTFNTEGASFVTLRRSLIAKTNATKGNLHKLLKSRLLSKDEKEAVKEIIAAYDKFTTVYNSWRDKKRKKGLQA